jgi:endoglucanase
MKHSTMPRLWHAVTALALFSSACVDSPTDISESDPAQLAVVVANVDIASPAPNVTLSGSTLLKARLTNRSTYGYTMTWQVDGGARTTMTVNGDYHTASVDPSTWNWRGAGPYTITFVAEEKVKGKKVVVGNASIQVYTGTVAPPVSPPPVTSGNPFASAAFYVDPYSNAKKTADSWRATRPADAFELDKIGSQPQADWFGSWNTDIYAAVNARMSTITAAGALPVLVAYHIPFRDCGGYSSGGAASPDAYRSWITSFANAIGSRKAVVVLEPDALAALSCLSAADQLVRMELIKYAVQTLKAKGSITVYVDAGHSRWQAAPTMISRLTSAGIALADGFSLNVSNFIASAELRTYGEQISAGVGNKHFIIDTSRNGQGANGEWCNPNGRGLGAKATSNTGAPLVDAFFWIKRPGESDGSCNGGPAAGKWWAESSVAEQAHALGLARRATALLAFND